MTRAMFRSLFLTGAIVTAGTLISGCSSPTTSTSDADASAPSSGPPNSSSRPALNAACFSPLVTTAAPTYLGHTLSEATSIAHARQDQFIVVATDGRCNVRAAPQYVGPHLIVEVEVDGDKIIAARGGYYSTTQSSRP